MLGGGGRDEEKERKKVAEKEREREYTALLTIAKLLGRGVRDLGTN